MHTYKELKPIFSKINQGFIYTQVNEVLSTLICHNFNLSEIDLSARAWKLTKDSVVPCQKLTMPFPWNPRSISCF